MSFSTLPLEDPQVLRNMSAPPRSTLTLHPFQVPTEATPETGHGRPTNWGLNWFTRVTLDGILRSRWPDWAAVAKSDHSATRRVHLRLCGAVALARYEVGSPVHPSSLESELGEDLGDELFLHVRELAASQSLPPLMLATPALYPGKPIDEDPVLTLVILTHVSGRTCEPEGSPLLSSALCEGHVIDLWATGGVHV